MSLGTYNKKRDFKATPEPSGKAAKESKQLIFVVQRHDASHLHYDFRLELDGVLKSWAVPKGPSLYPKDRRLAVHVEDHPVSYAKFKGDIPAGNYGAGHVDIWDKGTYLPVDEAGEELSHKEAMKLLEEGHLRFVMKGKKLKGMFKLFRMKEDDKNWLLMKNDDEYAVEEPYDIEAANTARKTPTGKTIKKKARPAEAIAKTDTPEERYTDFIVPMMARLSEAPFDDENWIFEIKWDGYRAIAECNGKASRLYSRNGLSFSTDYPAVDAAVRAIKRKMVLDGEIVAFDEKGEPRFQLLQNARSTGIQLLYYVFDILYLDGKSVEGLSTLDRKKLLKEVLPEGDVIRFADHVVGDGMDFFRAMQKRGLEGMIAKRASGVYEEGRRSEDWLKIKHVITDEAVICGYTEPRGTRKYFGALILGDYSSGKLEYIGHTGTGFNYETLKTLYETMQDLRADESPFEGKRIPVNAPVTWLLPELVCNVKYTEVTKDGIRRHPVFMGLRKDKEAREVDRADASKVPSGLKSANARSTKADNTDNTMEDFIKAGKQKVEVTNRQKVFWPEEGYTKGDVIEYYNAVSKYILPYLKGRPLSLRRNPNGIADAGFFHKDAGDNAPDWVRTEPIWSESSERDVDYIIADDKATLLYLANLGSIEINPWHSKVGNLGMPDYLVIDLDPSDKNTFDQVVETAKAVRQVCDSAGIDSYCKTSGSTGLHIYVPMGAKYTYEQVNQFAELLATRTHELVPDFTSLERSIKKRGPAIYMDYMQNNIAQTVACPYSLRPKPHATVSAPLDWKEVRKGLDMQRFNIKTMLKRIEAKGDLFKPVLGKGINMPAALKKLGA
jgi:bifunctional non-homologous end joining protein LigD